LEIALDAGSIPAASTILIVGYYLYAGECP